MKSAALFDFDKTIVNSDTGFEFIVYVLKKNPVRYLLALVISPMAFLFFISTQYRFIGNSIFLWLSTCGLTKKQTINLRRQFIRDYINQPSVMIYQDAINQIKDHQINGDKVYIVSGSSKWMVKKILSYLGLNNLTIIGSREKRLLIGMIANEHCYSFNKIKMLKEIVTLDSFDYMTGYTDSSADIPMLSLCDEKIIINPKRRCLQKYQKAFGREFKVRHWS